MGRPRQDRTGNHEPCLYCGKEMSRKRINGRLEDNGAFERRKYCDQNCMANAMVVGVDRNDDVYRRIARTKISTQGGCEKCGSDKKVCVHHRDRNPKNNKPDNLQRLCVSCHRKIHRPRTFCSICGKKVKGFGYCAKHYARYKKWGSPYVIKKNQHSLPVCVE